MPYERISRRRLALWLTWPAIRGEFGPAHPFEDGPDMATEPPWPRGEPGMRNLRTEFLASLRRAVGNSEGVAVATSGGLDSLAVLANLILEHGDQCRITAVAIEMIDDRGTSNIPVVRNLLEGIGLRCDLRIVPISRRPTGVPEWHAEGPRLDALPDANRLLVELAHEAGADVLLTGDGADELLGSGQYLTPHLLRHGNVRALPDYWRDHRGEYQPTKKLEALAVLSPVLGRRRRAMTYLACSWPELCSNPPHDFLAEPYRGIATAWTKSWIGSLVRLHERHHDSLAAMEAWSDLYPHQRLRTAGLVRNEDPFLDPEFVERAKRLPLHRRYDPSYPHPYWRMKSQVIKLMPPGALAYLPTAKQIFSRAIVSRVDPAELSAKYLLESGILSARALSGDLDPMVATRIVEVEQWLATAMELGYELVD
ncbi:asparagine synthase-related protein [Streptomyces triculaminicus]|uniref:asparagine synthase-related protein n=1 Tax=Streptomyces triculaminicus TaxID=2816232 RepID=UPI0033FB8F2C